MHGILDGTIPYNDTTSEGNGPEGSLIAFDGFYFDRKSTLLHQWAEKMQCDDFEYPYPTAYDGQYDFQCLEKFCQDGKSIVRCFGTWDHEYPLPNNIYVSAKVAYQFMLDHPRQ